MIHIRIIELAMASSIAATFAEGPIIINNSDCVEKSYKNFFKDFKSLGGISNVLIVLAKILK
ncbi:hypothetical protein [Peptoniphilus porci]|uniref:hypothetical protein n=1 Tax=Peptoniphilus porci TaxID=2652280 RepID=UPI001F3B0DAB|nr:hypothetical protein [Peptoniphilus porci]